MHTRTWHVDVYLTENDGMTSARAVLHADSPNEVVGTGHAQRSRQDPDVPEIGDEVAAGRALAALSRELLDTAQTDLNDVLAASTTAG